LGSQDFVTHCIFVSYEIGVLTPNGQNCTLSTIIG
jgi:hypothetical protein